MFTGLYAVGTPAPPAAGMTDTLSQHVLTTADSVEIHPLERMGAFADYAGRLIIDWGMGTRTWVQRADRQDKPILELRERFVEPSFPRLRGVDCASVRA